MTKTRSPIWKKLDNLPPSPSRGQIHVKTLDDIPHEPPRHPMEFLCIDDPDPTPVGYQAEVGLLLSKFFVASLDGTRASRIRWVFACAASRLALDLPHDSALSEALNNLLEIRNVYIKTAMKEDNPL